MNLQSRSSSSASGYSEYADDEVLCVCVNRLSLHQTFPRSDFFHLMCIIIGFLARNQSFIDVKFTSGIKIVHIPKTLL